MKKQTGYFLQDSSAPKVTPRALEQRFMFDAAAAASVTQTLDVDSHEFLLAERPDAPGCGPVTGSSRPVVTP